MQLTTGLIGLGALLCSIGALDVVGDRMMARRETEDATVLPPGVPGRFLNVGGHRVHIVERGAGPVLLLVHGTAGTTLDWETSVLDAFAERHRVIALDLYGMGFSDRDDRFAYGFALWADQLASTLDALGVDQAAVVGQSLGGAIATFFAATYPSRVTRVVSVDSGPWLPPAMLPLLMPGVGEVVLGLSELWPERPDQGAPYVERLHQVYSIRGARQHLLRAIRGQFLRSGPYLGALTRVECPTLLVHGSADPIIPLRAASALQRVLPMSEMVVIDGAGHFSMQDDPRRFVEIVGRFLDGADPGGRP